jgi:TPR repeat protein/DNA-directed RNA polymerase subunit RPC12/RpoP
MSNPFHDEKGDTDSMPEDLVIYICEHCGERFDAAESDVAHVVACPHCQTETVLGVRGNPGALEPELEPAETITVQPAKQTPVTGNVVTAPAKPEPAPTLSAPPEDLKSGDSLVKCKDCDKVISKLAEACPSCGRPQKVKPSIFYYVFTGTMSFVLTGIFILAALVFILESYFPDFYERAVIKGIVLRLTETDEHAKDAIPLQKNVATTNQASQATTPPSEEEVATFERMLKKTKAGDPAAQHYIGYCYDMGQGVEQNDSQAYEWYFKAALNGSAEAQSNLAGMFMDGRGGIQDYASALHWYTEAAKQDLPWAQFNLGTLYDKGLGVPQNYKEAFTWYYRAADSGDPNAQFNVAMMHFDGQGANLDLVQALKWAVLASSKGHEGAEELRRALTESDKRLTQEQITQAQREASDFKPRKAAGKK